MKKSILISAIWLLIVILGAGSVVSCSSVEEPATAAPNEREEIVLDAKTRSVAEDLKSFYVNLTADVSEYLDSNTDTKDENVIVSPLSISMLLSMIANGMEEKDREIITSYLGVQDMESLNSLANILLTELPKADNQVKTLLANSLWTNNLYRLNDNFLSTMDSKYMAEVDYVDMDNSKQTTSKINNWCKKNTSGIIPGLIDMTSSQTLAIFLNALYFNGKWEEGTFKSEESKEIQFDGVKDSFYVSMMHSSSKMRRYSETDNFRAFWIPFGNSSFSMMVVIQREGLSLSDVNGLLTSDEIHDLQNNSVSCIFDIYLPKFNIKNKLDLNGVFSSGDLMPLLEELNLPMFEPASKGLIIFKHAASIDVNESGAEGAAVSSAEIISTAPSAGELIGTVTVDRPFYFFITEYYTDACVLSGRVTDPR